MSLLRLPLPQLGQGGAADAEGMVWSDSLNMWVPRSVVQSVVEGSNITIDDTDPANPIISAAAGGISSAWSTLLNVPLTNALTGWTAGAGTWAALSDRFRLNSSATNAAMRLHYNTRLPFTSFDIQVDIRIDVSTNTTSSRAGIVLGSPIGSDAGGGLLIALAASGVTTHATKVHTEIDAVANILDQNLAANIIHGTWITMRVTSIGDKAEVRINGIHMFTARMMSTSAGGVLSDVDLGRFALAGFAVDASFKNLRASTLTLP